MDLIRRYPTQALVVCLLLAGLVALAFTGNLGGSGGDSEEPSLEEDHMQAVMQCEEFTKKRLKAPSTAEFNLSASGARPRFTVTGTVDAENSFGAAQRSNITCKIRFEEDRAVLESLTGLG